MGRKRKEIK